MKLEQSFDVAAPPHVVFETLVDVERVAPCLPGAEVSGHEDNVYRGTFTIKLGPTTAVYNGSLSVDDVDHDAHTATLHAKGTDKRGQGGATATVRSTVLDDGNGGSHVEVVTDFSITGKLARFGRGGMIQDVANRMMKDFSSCLGAQIASEHAAASAGGGAGAMPGVEAGGGDALGAAAAAGTGAGAGATPPPRTPPQPAKPVNGLKVALLALFDALKRLLGNLLRLLQRGARKLRDRRR